MKHKISLFIWTLLLAIKSVHGGVGQGNPNSIVFYNQTYRYQVQFEKTDYEIKTASDDQVELWNLNGDGSFVQFSSKPTTILSMEQLISSEESLKSCALGKIGGLEGFLCSGRTVVLVPGVQIIDIRYSEDAKASKILESFQYFTIDRLPFWGPGYFNFEPGSDYSPEFLGLIEQDQKIVLVSQKRIMVRNTNDLSLVLEIPFDNYFADCVLHARSQQVACGGRNNSLHVWNLTNGNEIWSFQNTTPFVTVRTPLFIDENTLLFSEGYSGPVYEIKIGSNSATKKFESVYYPQDFFRLGGKQYLTLQKDLETQLIDYKNLKIIQSYPKRQFLYPVEKENKIIKMRYLDEPKDTIELTKFDPVSLAMDWTVYHSKEKVYDGLTVGEDFFVVRDFDGNLHFYDLATGHRRPEFVQTLGGSSGISNNSFQFFIGEDKKTFYRKGPSQFTISHLDPGTLKKKITLDSVATSLQLMPGNHLLLKKNNPTGLALFSLNFEKQISQIPMSFAAAAKASATSDLSKVATVDGDIFQYDLMNGTLLTKYSGLFFVNEVVSLPNGGIVANYWWGLSIIDFPSQKITDLLSREDGHFQFLKVDAEGKYLIFSDNRRFYAYDLVHKKLVIRKELPDNPEDGRNCQIHDLRFSKNNTFTIASYCGLFQQELTGNQELKNLMIPGFAILSPSEKFYAVKEFRFDRILVYETATNEKVNELWGHSDPGCLYLGVGNQNCKGILDFVFLPDDTLITTGADRTIRHWKAQ